MTINLTDLPLSVAAAHTESPAPTSTVQAGLIDRAVNEALRDGVDEPELARSILTSYGSDVPVHIALALSGGVEKRMRVTQVAWGDYAACHRNAVFAVLALWAEALFIGPAGNLGFSAVYRATRHRAAPPTFLTLAAEALNRVELSGVAENPAAPVDVLRSVLSRVTAPGQTWADYQVLRNLASNPAAPVDVLGPLAWNRDDWVRTKVAGNPNLPRQALQTLAKDTSVRVRKAATANLVRRESRA